MVEGILKNAPLTSSGRKRLNSEQNPILFQTESRRGCHALSSAGVTD